MPQTPVVADGGRAERTERREKKADDRRDELRAAVTTILAEKKLPMTRKELWDALRVNDARFKEVLLEGVGSEWEREGSQGGGFKYRSIGG